MYDFAIVVYTSISKLTHLKDDALSSRHDWQYTFYSLFAVY